MIMYNQTLVVDFDETLALNTNDREKFAEPNIDLINKLNDLYDKGWHIHIVTARGHYSAPEGREHADRMWRPTIERWLENHGVKYSSLSFQKKLAVWYIDDKAIQPHDFLKIEL